MNEDFDEESSGHQLITITNALGTKSFKPYNSFHNEYRV